MTNKNNIKMKKKVKKKKKNKKKKRYCLIKEINLTKKKYNN